MGEQGSFPNRGSLRGFDRRRQHQGAGRGPLPADHLVRRHPRRRRARLHRRRTCLCSLSSFASRSIYIIVLAVYWLVRTLVLPRTYLQLGGAPYSVLLGRRDSTTASLNLPNSDLPPPGSSLASLSAASPERVSAPPTLSHLQATHALFYLLQGKKLSLLDSRFQQGPTRSGRRSAPTSGAVCTATPTSTRRTRPRSGAPARSRVETAASRPWTWPRPPPSTTPSSTASSRSAAFSTPTSTSSMAAPPTSSSAPTWLTRGSSGPTSPRPWFAWEASGCSPEKPGPGQGQLLQ
jgi:hypothetical protein